MKCVDCGTAVNPNRLGVYREVAGWGKVRADGGFNTIAMKSETGKLLCSGCGERRKLNERWGIDPGQTSLM